MTNSGARKSDWNWSGKPSRWANFPGAVRDQRASLAQNRGPAVCKRLGLRPAPIATQVVPRDLHAEFINALALVAASIERWATEFRHLQRTEVLEAEEYFAKGQKRSSAMPHKRNPITGERLSGLARVLRRQRHRPRSKTSLCGMNATSATARSNALSFQTPAPCSTTCSSR